MTSTQPSTLPSFPITPRAEGCPVPLTTSQQIAWNQLTAVQHKSNKTIAIASRVLGALDVALLNESVESVVARHDALRTTIAAVDGTLLQRIDAQSRHCMREIDLTAQSSSDRQLTARRVADELIQEDVDLSRGPLFEATLLRLSSDEHVVLLAMDHMISDAASAEIVNRELWAAYNEKLQGSTLPAPRPRLQFADYAVWQQQTYASWQQQHEAYWRKHLKDSPNTFIPIDRGSVEDNLRASAIKHLPLGKKLSDELRLLAQRERVLLPVVVLVVYACVMSRWCNQEDLLLQFTTHGRRGYPELKSMVGFLANRLYFRIRVLEMDKFTDLLQRVSQEFALAFEHYDFDRAATLECKGSTELLFNWITTRSKQELGKRQGRRFAEAMQLQRFQVGMTWLGKFWPFFYDTAAGITVTVAFRPDLFVPDTIERFGRQLRSFAQALVQTPQAPIASVSRL